jgi:hypothetical protein
MTPGQKCGVRPWDRHPPWAHWGFFVIWVIAGTLGPIVLIVGLLEGGSTTSIWIGVGLCVCGVWALDLVLDWMAVRVLKARHADLTPWQEPRRHRSAS